MRNKIWVACVLMLVLAMIILCSQVKAIKDDLACKTPCHVGYGIHAAYLTEGCLGCWQDYYKIICIIEDKYIERNTQMDMSACHLYGTCHWSQKKHRKSVENRLKEELKRLKVGLCSEADLENHGFGNLNR